MIKPIVVDDLFELDPTFQVTEFTTRPVPVLIVDGFYRNFSAIQEVLQTLVVERWKYQDNGRNFVDYYDCRPRFHNAHAGDKHRAIFQTIHQLISKYFGRIEGLRFDNAPGIEMNYFSNINKDVSNRFQHFPHRDYMYNCIVYLDEISSGGTAIYADAELESKEDINLLTDISDLTIQTIIPAKPNRLAIYEGHRLHGGYIEDHNAYVGAWRINQVIFARPKQPLGEQPRLVSVSNADNGGRGGV